MKFSTEDALFENLVTSLFEICFGKNQAGKMEPIVGCVVCFPLLALLFLRFYLAGSVTCKTSNRLEGKTVIVTGEYFLSHANKLMINLNVK